MITEELKNSETERQQDAQTAELFSGSQAAPTAEQIIAGKREIFEKIKDYLSPANRARVLERLDQAQEALQAAEHPIELQPAPESQPALPSPFFEQKQMSPKTLSIHDLN